MDGFIRYDTIAEFNVLDSKAEYSAVSSTVDRSLVLLVID